MMSGHMTLPWWEARLLFVGATRAVLLLRPSVSPWPLPTAASDSDDPVYR